MPVDDIHWYFAISNFLLGDNQEVIDAPQTSNGQAKSSDIAIDQLHQQPDDETTCSVSSSQNDPTSKEVSQTNVS